MSQRSFARLIYECTLLQSLAYLAVRETPLLPTDPEGRPPPWLIR